MSNRPEGAPVGIEEQVLDVVCDHLGRGMGDKQKVLISRIQVSTFGMAGFPDALGWDIHELPHPGRSAKRSRYGLPGQTERARSEMENMTGAVWRFECPICGLTASYHEARLSAAALRLVQHLVGQVTVRGLTDILG